MHQSSSFSWTAVYMKDGVEQKGVVLTMTHTLTLLLLFLLLMLMLTKIKVWMMSFQKIRPF